MAGDYLEELLHLWRTGRMLTPFGESSDKDKREPRAPVWKHDEEGFSVPHCPYCDAVFSVCGEGYEGIFYTCPACEYKTDSDAWL
jgi:hypothetical protein